MAVATGRADVAFGTDTGGSIRVPSACYGIYGLKTTFGLVSIKGVFPISPKHLDTVGPMARNVNHLVPTSRNGAATPAAEDFLIKLRARGVNVQVIKADAGSAMDVKRVLGDIASLGHPLKGVFHLAMVIDDAPMAALTRERMIKVIAPKAHGAWQLHEVQKMTLVLVTHDMIIARKAARTLQMLDGRIVFDGPQTP